MSAVTSPTLALNTFTCDFYRHLSTHHSHNLVLAPYAIYTAFAMVFAGTRGTTAAEIARVFHFADGSTATLKAVAELNAALPHDATTLTLANALWTQAGYAFLPDYLILLETHLHTLPHPADFAGDSAAAVSAINAWVQAQTHGQITQILEAVSPLARLVLVSAVTFKGSWQFAFDEHYTRHQLFTTLDGRKTTIPMMARQAPFGYAQGQGWQAVTLPYQDGRLAMIAILPADGFADVEQGLSAEMVALIQAQTRPTPLMVEFPRWQSESDVGVPQLLQAMGVRAVFSRDSADLSGMNGTPADLYVAEARHRAVIEVNEAGTEASAATAVVVATRSFRPAPEPMHLTFDRPFLYLIVDQPTGMVLFVGRQVQ